MIDRGYFDKICERRGTGSIKYGIPPAGDPEKVVPMWVADMDFRSAPCIISALDETVKHGIFGYTDKGGEGFMRMNIACPEKVLLEVLDNMRKTVI